MGRAMKRLLAVVVAVPVCAVLLIAGAILGVPREGEWYPEPRR